MDNSENWMQNAWLWGNAHSLWCTKLPGRKGTKSFNGDTHWGKLMLRSLVGCTTSLLVFWILLLSKEGLVCYFCTLSMTELISLKDLWFWPPASVCRAHVFYSIWKYLKLIPFMLVLSMYKVNAVTFSFPFSWDFK